MRSTPADSSPVRKTLAANRSRVFIARRWGVPRRVAIEVEKLPRGLRNGVWRERIVDGNIWHGRGRAELTVCKARSVGDGRFEFYEKLMPNSVTLVEVGAGSLNRCGLTRSVVRDDRFLVTLPEAAFRRS